MAEITKKTIIGKLDNTLTITDGVISIDITKDSIWNETFPGDLLVSNGSNESEILEVGTEGQALKVKSGGGLEWGDSGLTCSTGYGINIANDEISIDSSEVASLPISWINDRYLISRDNNTFEWTLPSGSGDVIGPYSSELNFASFKDLTGKELIDSGYNAFDFAPSIHVHDNYVISPEISTENKIPQWDENNKTLKDGLTVGTSANNLVQLNSEAKLPEIDGSNLINVVPTLGIIVSTIFPYTLPESPDNGTVLKAWGNGTNWTITANTGQYIRFHNIISVADGSISSTNGWDSITLVYISKDTTWRVDSYIGIPEII